MSLSIGRSDSACGSSRPATTQNTRIALPWRSRKISYRTFSVNTATAGWHVPLGYVLYKRSDSEGAGTQKALVRGAAAINWRLAARHAGNALTAASHNHYQSAMLGFTAAGSAWTGRRFAGASERGQDPGMPGYCSVRYPTSAGLPPGRRACNTRPKQNRADVSHVPRCPWVIRLPPTHGYRWYRGWRPEECTSPAARVGSPPDEIARSRTSRLVQRRCWA